MCKILIMQLHILWYMWANNRSLRERRVYMWVPGVYEYCWLFETMRVEETFERGYKFVQKLPGQWKNLTITSQNVSRQSKKLWVSNTNENIWKKEDGSSMLTIATEPSKISDWKSIGLSNIFHFWHTCFKAIIYMVRSEWHMR